MNYLLETIKLLNKLSDRELKIIYYTVKTIVEGRITGVKTWSLDGEVV